MLAQLPGLTLSSSAMAVLTAAERAGRPTLAGSLDELVALAVPEAEVDSEGFFTVGYDVPGRGFVAEARVCGVRNGVAANYIEPALRRRDPDCMVKALAWLWRPIPPPWQSVFRGLDYGLVGLEPTMVS
jgi:hypothetical protein